MKWFLVEPYAYSRGHPRRNFSELPKAFQKNNLDFEFFVEKSLNSPKKKNIKAVLQSGDDFLYQTSTDTKTIRYQEIQKIIKLSHHGVLWYLTAYDRDFDVFCELFQDLENQRIICTRKYPIIIQSGAAIFSALENNKKNIEKIFSALGSKVVVSYFSDLLVKKSKQIVPKVSVCQITLPVYDKTISIIERDKPFSISRKFIDLGIIFKNKTDYPNLAKTTIDSFNHERLHAQILPFNGEQPLHVLNKNLLNKINITTGFLSHQRYLKNLSQSKTRIFFYNQSQFRWRASQVLEDCFILKIPVLVPIGTWLERYCKRLNHTFLSYNPADSFDYLNKFNKIISFEGLTKSISPVFLNIYRSEKIFERLLSVLESTPDYIDFNTFFQGQYDECYESESRSQSDNFNTLVLSKKPLNFGTREVLNYIKKIVPNKVSLGFKEEIQKLHLNYGQLLYWTNNLIRYGHFEITKKIIQLFIKREKKLTTTQSLEIQTILFNCDSSNAEKKSYFEVIDQILKRNRTKLSFHLKYKIASIYESQKKYTDAFKLFTSLLRNKNNTAKELIGLYYHLGFTSFAMQKRNKAKLYIYKLLSLCPTHQKGLEIQKKLNNCELEETKICVA